VEYEMGLSPEEKQRIYEEEKERVEARERIERERQTAQGTKSIGLEPNVAGLLCYVGGWISGIIFFFLEQKNRWVRFHAAQSIVVFGTITVAGIVLGLIPVVGHAFSWIVSITGFILWIILMVKAYNGERYKLPWAGDIAENMVAVQGVKGEYTEPPPPPEAPVEPPSPPGVDLGKQPDQKVERYSKSKRNTRITESSFAIAWSIVLLVFLNFFHEYIAYYSAETIDDVTKWTRYPFFTEDINLWLPILTTALSLTIIGHIILIIFDRYALREIIMIILSALSLASVLTLLTIFPFDFSVIPNTTAANATYIAVTIVLILTSVGIGISTIVRFIRLLVQTAKQSTSY
jgi:uncharacterized membrane protein